MCPWIEDLSSSLKSVVLAQRMSGFKGQQAILYFVICPNGHSQYVLIYERSTSYGPFFVNV